MFSSSFSPDGKVLSFGAVRIPKGGRSWAIWTLPLDQQERKPELFYDLPTSNDSGPRSRRTANGSPMRATPAPTRTVDGRTLVMVFPAAQTAAAAPVNPRIRAVLNWTEELKTRVR